VSVKNTLYIRYKNLKNRLIGLLAGWHVFGNPSANLKIVGVTGTNGKTSIATILYRVFTELGYKCGLVGTAGNIVAGVEREAECTTPGAIELHGLLNEMVETGCDYVFLEVSSHAMVQARVAGIKFAGGVFTNLTQDHLDYHGSMKNYFRAKKKFFRKLPKNAFAVSNTDDQFGARMLEGIRAKTFSYGFESEANFSERLQTNLKGDFNSYNALAVYAVAVLLGEESEAVKEILRTVEPPKGRFDCISSPTGVVGVVDYAHTPDALENVLKTIASMCKDNQRIISVFGCGGDRDTLKRPLMGKVGAALSDTAIFTADNPRAEDPNQIIREMQVSLTDELREKVRSIPDRREAIAEAAKLAGEGDYILLAGKGPDTYQEIDGVKHYFNDVEEFERAYGLLSKI
jgi:UDP-N-acetylmuramoyl-L-alanyl-D-glutamate--2,6-diaminopimelate ligase